MHSSDMVYFNTLDLRLNVFEQLIFPLVHLEKLKGEKAINSVWYHAFCLTIFNPSHNHFIYENAHCLFLYCFHPYARCYYFLNDMAKIFIEGVTPAHQHVRNCEKIETVAGNVVFHC